MNSPAHINVWFALIYVEFHYNLRRSTEARRLNDCFLEWNTTKEEDRLVMHQSSLSLVRERNCVAVTKGPIRRLTSRSTSTIIAIQ